MAMETVGQTEEMRHIPSLQLLIDKLDREVRGRIETLYASCFESATALDSATVNQLETRFRQICRWLERLGEQARGRRPHLNHDLNLRSRVRSTLGFAIESLSALEATQFRRRQPFHCFERSRAECIYGAFMVMNCELDRLTVLATAIDPDLSMKLSEPPYELPPPRTEEFVATTA